MGKRSEGQPSGYSVNRFLASYDRKRCDVVCQDGREKVMDVSVKSMNNKMKGFWSN